MAKSKYVITQIKKATRRKFSADEKIRIVLEGLRGEASISEICRREGIASSVYYKWSKAFLPAGKNGLTQVSFECLLLVGSKVANSSFDLLTVLSCGV
jgi:transposase-like protein